METPILGGRWEARRLLALLTATCLAMAMILLYAGPAMADHAEPDDIIAQVNGPDGTNETPYWVNYLATERDIDDASCTKLNQDSEAAFVMPAAPDGEEWVLLVVKQATDNYVYFDPVAGHTYPSTGSQAPGYSHLIVCSVEGTPPSTTTTMPTSTSSSEPTTTTTEPTTTTTIESTTTSTEPEATCEDADYALANPDECDEVLPTIVTTTTIAGSDLPLTGARADMLFGLAMVLMAMGLGVLTLTRGVRD